MKHPTGSHYYNMKIIFLDFDGVLNHADWINRPGVDLSLDENHFSPECVHRLNEIIRRTGAAVVLSTSWRRIMAADDIRRLLKNVGAICNVIDSTPAYVHGSRDEEICEWLELNGCFGPFVVLDDCVDQLTKSRLEGRVVQTDFRDGGLKQEHVDMACRILGEV